VEEGEGILWCVQTQNLFDITLVATMSQIPKCMEPTQDDIRRLLACQVHIGTKNLQPDMARYVYTRRPDGVHIIHLRRMWEKLMLAARVISAVENPSDVCVISAKPYGQRAVLKFAKYTGATYFAGRFTPGTFTNQIQKKFFEPRLMIVTDPNSDHQPIRESSYVNMPCIAFCNTDSNLKFVDVAIPCNNKGKNSIAIMYWMLAREVLRLRGAQNGGISRSVPWDVMADLFLYRDPDEEEKKEEVEVPAKEAEKVEVVEEEEEWAEHPDMAAWEGAASMAVGESWAAEEPVEE